MHKIRIAFSGIGGVGGYYGGKLARYYHNSDVADKIDFRIGDANEEAPKLGVMFDLAFVDGDKRTYIETYEMVMKILNPGGYILADNTLWDGHVIDPAYDRDHQTKGIRAFNDLIAKGVIDECTKRGFRVPEDVSVVGFDDISIAATFDPPLTTIRQERNELGRCAYDILNSLIHHIPISKTLLRPKLIERESTARCAHRD